MSKTKFSMVPIKRTDIFQTIIQQLNELLDSQQLKIGDRLPSERELAEILGVSRTSIRQALKVVEASGRIETRVGSGTYLVEKKPADDNQLLQLNQIAINKQFMQQLIIARTGIERTIFEEFATHATQQQISLLQELVEEMAAETPNITDNFEEDGGLDLSFEAKVAELTGNVVLINIQQQIHQLWVKAWSEYGFVPEKKSTIENEHLQIISALTAHNVKQVIELIVQHVDKDIE